MQVKNVRTPQGADWGKVKAYFSIVTDEGIEIHSCRVIDGSQLKEDDALLHGKKIPHNDFYVTPPAKMRRNKGQPVLGSDGKPVYDNLAWIPKALFPELIDLLGNDIEVSGEEAFVPADEDIPF